MKNILLKAENLSKSFVKLQADIFQHMLQGSPA